MIYLHTCPHIQEPDDDDTSPFRPHLKWVVYEELIRQSYLVYEKPGNADADSDSTKKTLKQGPFEKVYSPSDEAFVREMLNLILTGELHCFLWRVLVPPPPVTHTNYLHVVVFRRGREGFRPR